jgi:hypothetical protein
MQFQRARSAPGFSISPGPGEITLKPIAARPIAAPRRTVEWSKERIAGLAAPEITQLRANAERLNDPDIMGRCDEVLKEKKAAARIAAKALRDAAAPKAAPAAKAASASKESAQ